MWLCMNWLRKAIVHEFLPYRREAMMAEQMFGDERSVTRSTHGNREFADLSLLLCNIHNHPTGTLIAVCISGVHHCCYSYSWTGMCCWAACPICFSIGGRCAWKESTCSIVGVLLDSDDLPMGVMRERGMARCCMIDNAEERCWAGERRRRDAGAGADADAVGCVELGGELGGTEKQKE